MHIKKKNFFYILMTGKLIKKIVSIYIMEEMMMVIRIEMFIFWGVAW